VGSHKEARPDDELILMGEATLNQLIQGKPQNSISHHHVEVFGWGWDGGVSFCKLQVLWRPPSWWPGGVKVECKKGGWNTPAAPDGLVGSDVEPRADDELDGGGEAPLDQLVQGEAQHQGGHHARDPRQHGEHHGGEEHRDGEGGGAFQQAQPVRQLRLPVLSSLRPVDRGMDPGVFILEDRSFRAIGILGGEGGIAMPRHYQAPCLWLFVLK